MRDYGVPRYYGDWREMIDTEQPDFVDIITPPETHEEMCRYAAERGVHIICQKPLAPTYAESRRIVEFAASAGVRFMVHENLRWQPWYRAIKRLQRDGTIGDFTHAQFTMRMGDGWGADAYLARQPFFRDYPKLLVYETGVHFIDTFRYLFGEVTGVFAHLRRLNPCIRGEDAGQLFLAFENGATAIWDANRYNETEAALPRFTFGHLRIDALNGHLTLDTESNLRVKVLGEAGLRPRLRPRAEELRRRLRVQPAAPLHRLHALGRGVRIERFRLSGHDRSRRRRLSVGGHVPGRSPQPDWPIAGHGPVRPRILPLPPPACQLRSTA